MATRRLPIGPEDNVQEIDTNLDGQTDVYVVTDNLPQQDIETLPTPTPLPSPEPPPGGWPMGGGSTPDPNFIEGLLAHLAHVR